MTDNIPEIRKEGKLRIRCPGCQRVLYRNPIVKERGTICGLCGIKIWSNQVEEVSD